MSRALTVFALLAIASVAHAELVDRVAAFVDDEVVLLSEVRERAEPELRGDPSADRLAVYRRVLGQLIDYRLIGREARRLGAVVTDEEVRSAVARLQQENGFDEHQWSRALVEQGWTEPVYEQALREQLLQWKVMQLLTARTLTRVTDEEVRAEWERRAEAFEHETRYRVAELSQSLPVGADEDARASARARIEGRVEAVRRGQPASAVGGVEVGWILASELPAETRAILDGLDTGALSAIQETAGGFTALQLLERGQTEPLPLAPQAETIREELFAERFRVANERAMAELRAEAMIARRL